MADDVELRPKTIMIEGKAVPVREDADIPLCIGEVVVEARLLDSGVLALSLGHFVFDMNSKPEIRVNSRLRLLPEVIAYLEGEIAQRRAAAAEFKKAAN